MKAPFDQWAPAEIARLRAEANALEHALTLYLSNGSSAPTLTSSTDKRRGPRISKYEPLFQAFEQERRPLSMDDMLQIAERIGVQINRANMRSQVFVQKGTGRARFDGANYVWELSERETASNNKEDAVS